jgi:hypothetical protein
VTVTAKLDPGLDKSSARDAVRTLLAWQLIRVISPFEVRFGNLA